MITRTVLGAAIVAMSLGIGACGGSNTTVQQTETQGQQLMDLGFGLLHSGVAATAGGNAKAHDNDGSAEDSSANHGAFP